MRFRVEGELPNISKVVLIVAPHTSNWDFVVGLAARYVLGLDISWLGKHTLFRPPFGALFRRWGGIPVDRRSSHDLVSRVVEQFAARERLILAIAPEGTRKAVTAWRTEFWHIASGAGVPIMPVALDWGRRVVHIGAVVPTNEVEEDVRRLREWYTAFRGRTR